MIPARPTVAELTAIAELARRQRDGAFTTQADAMVALDLVAKLADALAGMAAAIDEIEDAKQHEDTLRLERSE